MAVEKQSPHTILMVEPVGFHVNQQTASTNHFQSDESSDYSPSEMMAQQAICEHQQLAELLREHGTSVISVPGNKACPDDLFPNNWFSTHQDENCAVIYPMQSVNRRTERQPDLVRAFKEHYQQVIDLTHYEQQGKALEGTGSIIFDRVHKILYAALSPRTDETVLLDLTEQLDYQAMIFKAADQGGQEIYHTNVLMWIGTSVAGVCAEAIHPDHREQVLKVLERTHEICEISLEQVNQFAGNAFEVRNENNVLALAMSDRAYQSLSEKQLVILNDHYSGRFIHPVYQTPERSGGSVRCSLAGLFANNIDALRTKLV